MPQRLSGKRNLSLWSEQKGSAVGMEIILFGQIFLEQPVRRTHLSNFCKINLEFPFLKSCLIWCDNNPEQLTCKNCLKEKKTVYVQLYFFSNIIITEKLEYNIHEYSYEYSRMNLVEYNSRILLNRVWIIFKPTMCRLGNCSKLAQIIECPSINELVVGIMADCLTRDLDLLLMGRSQARFLARSHISIVNKNIESYTCISVAIHLYTLFWVNILVIFLFYWQFSQC